MRRVVMMLAVTACRAARAPAPPLPDRTPYLVLFEQGRSFTLDARQRGGMDTVTEVPGMRRTHVTCTVAEVKQVGDATVSRLACTAPHAGLSIAGTWVSTPAGLYHPHVPVDDPDELSLLGEDDLLIGATPKERDHGRALEGAEESIETFTHEGSWCVTQTTTAGNDQRSYSLCFGRAGVTGGNDIVVAGGTVVQLVRFGAAPPDNYDKDEEPDDE